MNNVRKKSDFCALYMKTERNNFTQKAKKVLTFSFFMIEYISLGSIAQLGEHLPYKVRVLLFPPRKQITLLCSLFFLCNLK